MPRGSTADLLNLLKFKAEVTTPAEPRSGMDAYSAYSMGVGKAFVRAGGKTLYFGKVGYLFGTVAGTAWDAPILTRYPSPLALAGFWLDEEFVAAHRHRASGVEQSRVLAPASLR